MRHVLDLERKQKRAARRTWVSRLALLAALWPLVIIGALWLASHAGIDLPAGRTASLEQPTTWLRADGRTDCTISTGTTSRQVVVDQSSIVSPRLLRAHDGPPPASLVCENDVTILTGPHRWAAEAGRSVPILAVTWGITVLGLVIRVFITTRDLARDAA